MNYNISATSFRGYGFLNKVTQNRAKSMEKLSSGYRINTASGDSAGSAMSSIMRAQIRGLEQGTRNSDDGVELLNSAESGLGQITSILQRIRELAVQSSNDTNTLDDRIAIQTEVDQLLVEIDRIAKTTEFNGVKLLNNEPALGGFGKGLAALVGKENITPDGTLSGRFNQYQMLDPATGGTNSSLNNTIVKDNPKPELTRIESSRNPASLEKLNVYQTFRDNSGEYTGDLYDALGNKLGSVIAGQPANLISPTNTVLPEDSTPMPVPSPYTHIAHSEKWIAPSVTPGPTPYTEYKNVSNNSTFISASSSGVYKKDASGQLVALSYEKHTGEREQGITNSVEYINENRPLKSAFIDFKKLNTPGGFTISDLYGTGFNSTCATCDNHYSIKFQSDADMQVPVTSPPGVSTIIRPENNAYTCRLTSYRAGNGTHQTLEINVDKLPANATGEDLVNHIINTINDSAISQPFFRHYNQYAAVGSTLYVFDHRTIQGNKDTFTAISYEDTLVKGSKENTAMKIQAGANAYEVVNIELPFISIKEMGINEIDLRDGVSANNAIPLLDNAIQFISIERAKIGTQRIRLEHASNIGQVSSLANTESESKIHDVDFSSEVINLTKLQMLEEYGVNSVVEINKMIENVVEFIK